MPSDRQSLGEGQGSYSLVCVGACRQTPRNEGPVDHVDKWEEHLVEWIQTPNGEVTA